MRQHGPDRVSRTHLRGSRREGAGFANVQTNSKHDKHGTRSQTKERNKSETRPNEVEMDDLSDREFRIHTDGHQVCEG